MFLVGDDKSTHHELEHFFQSHACVGGIWASEDKHPSLCLFRLKYWDRYARDVNSSDDNSEIEGATP